MAARRAGVTRVLIPEANLFDLREVAREVRDSLEIVPVNSVTDVLLETGILEEAARTA